MNKYIVIVFDGKKEHLHRSVHADSEGNAVEQVKKLYKDMTSLWNVEAFRMCG